MLAATPLSESLSDWSRDGKYLLYHTVDPETGFDLWYLEGNEDGSGWEPHPFLQTPFNEHAAKFSPDGRYVAYVSNESGQNEIYVRPFPEGEGKSTVSSNGGRQPRWSRDGTQPRRHAAPGPEPQGQRHPRLRGRHPRGLVRLRTAARFPAPGNGQGLPPR